jgi:hypothetical protein
MKTKSMEGRPRATTTLRVEQKIEQSFCPRPRRSKQQKIHFASSRWDGNGLTEVSQLTEDLQQTDWTSRIAERVPAPKGAMQECPNDCQRPHDCPPGPNGLQLHLTTCRHPHS